MVLGYIDFTSIDIQTFIFTEINYTKFIFNLVFRINVHVGHRREWALKNGGAQLKSGCTIIKVINLGA